MKKRIILIVTISIFVLASPSIFPTTAFNINNNFELDSIKNTSFIKGDGTTEYWAVLIWVDCTWYTDNVFIVSFKENVECMYKTLLVSDHWKSDHIKVVSGKNATVLGIIRALRWLDRMDDGDDVSLVYYSGHGGYLFFKNRHGVEIPVDLPPFDEQDRCDEYITTYWAGICPLAIITDDMLNFLLNRLDSQGVAVIFDSCYSGGMSDTHHIKDVLGRLSQNNYNAIAWMKGFSEDISKDGRVILMASRENESAWTTGWKLFGSFVSEGFQGYADSNEDGLVSAEESFEYAAPIYFDFIDGLCVPIIDDRYPGELLLTDVELPPSMPILSNNNVMIGKPGSVFVFDASSTDPESDTIRYGWNWRNDSVVFKNRWGYNVEEWSDYHLSGDVCTMMHSWSEPGVYTVRVKAQDEHGAEIIPDYDFSGLWTRPLYILITSDNETVDQYQLIQEVAYIIDRTFAQSFTPNATFISKIKLKLKTVISHDKYLEYYKKYPLNFSIRNSLDGEDLVKVSKKPYIKFLGLPRYYCMWIDFDFSDLAVTPDEKYYIVVSCDSEKELYGWGHTWNDSYQNGEVYYNLNGVWHPDSNTDFCFITYE